MDVYESRSAKPMLIASESEPFDSEEHFYELKMDGERCLAYLDGAHTDLINRRGRRVLFQFPELASLHTAVNARCILDGELIVGVGGKEEFELIKQRSQVKQPHLIERLSVENPCTFVALDILYLDGRLLTDHTLAARQEVLREQVVEKDRMAVVRTVDGRGLDFYRVVKEKGLEGVIAKRKDSLYHMGKRTWDWVKFKNWLDAEFIVCGFVPSDKANVVSLVLGQFNDENIIVYKGRVTIGANRPEFKVVQRQPRASGHPFPEDPPDGCDGAVWLEPKLVCNAGFLLWTVHKRLRQPFFRCLEPDLPPSAAREPD